MTLKTIATKKLAEHPRNKELFKDIRDSNPAFWEEFKGSIKEFGILEPLIVNKDTMQVRSGNQRLLAAIELGMEEVPVLLVDAEDTEEEIRKMITSNVYRRQIDPFALFEYIGRLRKGHLGSDQDSRRYPGKTPTHIGEHLHKGRRFVEASDIFNSLPRDQQESLREWFVTKNAGERARTEGELIAQLRKIESEKLRLDERVRSLEDDNITKEERQQTLDQLLKERDQEIKRLKDLDAEEEIASRDAQIRKLEGEKKKLKEALKVATTRPDLGVYLKGCIERQTATNAVLKDIVKNKESLDQEAWMKLVELFVRAFKTLKDSLKEAHPNDVLRLEDKS